MRRKIIGGSIHQCGFNPELSNESNAMTCSLEVTAKNADALSAQSGGKKKYKKSRKSRKSRQSKKYKKSRKTKKKRPRRKTKKNY